MKNKDRIIGNIYSTNNLSKFHINTLNRQINQKHVQEIVDSINKIGTIIQPIVVDKNFNILDGHHRISAVILMNKMGIKMEVPYTIKEDIDSVNALITMNAVSKTYGTKEFIDLYAKAQDGQSRKLVQIAEEINESPVTLLSVISCGSDVMRNREKIKNDEFIDFDDWDIVKDFYDFLKDIRDTIHLTTKTKQMLFRVFQIDKFDTKSFSKNAKDTYVLQGEKIRFSSRQNICKKQILNLYNKNKNKANRINYHQDSDEKVIIDD